MSDLDPIRAELERLNAALESDEISIEEHETLKEGLLRSIGHVHRPARRKFSCWLCECGEVYEPKTVMEA